MHFTHFQLMIWCDIQPKQRVIQAYLSIIRLILSVNRARINCSVMSVMSRTRKRSDERAKCCFWTLSILKPQQDGGNPRHVTVNFKAQDSFLELLMYLGRFTITVIRGDLVFQGRKPVTLPLQGHWTPLGSSIERLRAWKLRLAPA